ncbi:MAG: trypsin-like serine protease [Oligoflexia bacterium]|nr:trypsin-like serine protease [Oligoflexia bacterium]
MKLRVLCSIILYILNIFLCLSLLFSCSNSKNDQSQSQSQSQFSQYKSTSPIDLKIIGGSAVPSNRWKSAVALTDIRNKKMFCSGTLITRELVLTAAHCLKSNSFTNEQDRIMYIRVYVGSGVEGGKFIGQHKIKMARVHPQYDTIENQWADIGFVVLTDPIGQNDIRDNDFLPILDGQQEILNTLTYGKNIRLVGFGDRDFIEPPDEIEIDGIEADQNYCNTKSHSGIKYEVDVPLKNITGSELVWDGSYSCGHYYGDSGGPVYVKTQNGSWKIAAIISRGDLQNMEGIDVLVSPFICWIQETSNIQLPHTYKKCL